MTWDDEEEVIRRKGYEEKRVSEQILIQEKAKQEELLEKILKKQKEQTTKQNIEVFREHQKDIIDTNSQMVRQYLADNLVTFLADGLHLICTRQPEDPVDALAQYLFSRSLDVKYPDPTHY